MGGKIALWNERLRQQDVGKLILFLLDVKVMSLAKRNGTQRRRGSWSSLTSIFKAFTGVSTILRGAHDTYPNLKEPREWTWYTSEIIS